jgi:hypothetical protein
MRLVNIDDRYSLKSYINEDCIKSYSMKQKMEKIDEEFFKPWCQYLIEAELTADQIQQIFKTAHEKAQASGTNATGIGKIVEKLIPDSMIKKLHSSLPEPDPNAQPDPQFEKKASAAVNQLPVNSEVKGGLMEVVKAASKNPQMQSMILSLVGGVLGGLLSQVSPMIQTAIPGGGTIAVAITGAVVAGGVAVAAAKLQGKPWKEAFKGAIKPALAGAAGAVIGQIGASLASGAAGMMTKGAEPQPASQENPKGYSGQSKSDITSVGGDEWASDPNVKMTTYVHPDNGMKVQASVDGGSPFQPGTANYQARQQLRGMMNQSYEPSGRRLSEGQCYMIFNRTADKNRSLLAEGYLITEAGLLDKAGSWLKTKAQNVTQSVTADKLNSAWKKAGSPTDSNAVASVLTSAGVNAEVVKQVFADMKLPEPAAAPAAASDGSTDAAGAQSAAVGSIDNIIKTIEKLNSKDKEKVISHLEKSLGTA